MMEDIKSGKDGVSYVLVFKLSRFGRNAADVLATLQVMQDFGVNLICVEDGIDSSKDAEKLMISVLSAVAEIERENIRVQTMEGRMQKAREGKWNGGFAPYGYSLIDGKLEVNEEEAVAIRMIFDQYVNTDLSFALGNKLLGILDEKQHREREGDKNIGWYHKTDFVIKAVIGGEEFNYEGRFDIGDGEGDLIAHIKNFYDYALSPKGEQLYGDDRESLLRGRDEFILFLEQHTELTQEDEKLLDEIMATESDWYRTAEEAEEKPQANADKVNGSEAPVIEMEQSTDDLIGREIIIDNRKYLIESIGKISGDVSLRDITFQNNVGFPINRVEKIGYIQKLLEQ